MPDGDYVVHVVNNAAAGTPTALSDYLSSHQSSSIPFVPNLGIGWIIAGVIVLVLIWKSVVIVKQQSARIIELFGKFSKVATAGFNLKIPFVESVVGTVDLRIQELSKEVDAKSKDNSFLRIPVRVQYQVITEKVKEAFYTLRDAQNQMESYITNIVRSTASEMTMEEVFQSKDRFEKDVQELLNEKFSGFGYAIINVLVDNPMPSAEVVESFNKVIASQRLKEAATNEAEAIRVKTVGLAKAEAESLTLKATAYVAQRKTMAEFFEGLDDKTSNLLAGIDYRDMVRESSKSGSTVVIVPSTEAGNNMGQIISALQVK